jgi:glyoxylase-like metal-dependent hydrolase (beta-lactamase superfamily II)
MEPTGEAGVWRVTLPVPFALDHVHCYLVERPDGGYTLVDGGLTVPALEPRWARALSALDGPVREIFVTHHHPDHIGAVESLSALTGATVLQGGLDREQSHLWADPDTPDRERRHLLRHGVPDAAASAAAADTAQLSARIELPAHVRIVEPGDDVGGWTVVLLPGHADGHLALLRADVLIAGDAILEHISPHIGVHPETAADPLGRYLRSLRTLIDWSPRVALTGHRRAVHDVPGRARSLLEHHADRLESAERWLRASPRSAYCASQTLFPSELSASGRRFAVTETIAHLERLVVTGRATRFERDEGRVGYATAVHSLRRPVVAAIS